MPQESYTFEELTQPEEGFTWEQVTQSELDDGTQNRIKEIEAERATLEGKSQLPLRALRESEAFLGALANPFTTLAGGVGAGLTMMGIL